MHALKSMVKNNHEFEAMVKQKKTRFYKLRIFLILGTKFTIKITSKIFF